MRLDNRNSRTNPKPLNAKCFVGDCGNYSALNICPLCLIFKFRQKIVSKFNRIFAVANNRQIIAAENPVLGVLELAGGSTSKLGIKAGAIVKFPTFGSVRGSR